MVEVVLQPTPSEVRLEIKDNGCGFARQGGRPEASGLGLLWMQHAAETAGLRLEIQSAPGQGTMVRATHQTAHSVAAGAGA